MGDVGTLSGGDLKRDSRGMLKDLCRKYSGAGSTGGGTAPASAEVAAAGGDAEGTTGKGEVTPAGSSPERDLLAVPTDVGIAPAQFEAAAVAAATDRAYVGTGSMCSSDEALSSSSAIVFSATCACCCVADSPE